MSTVVSRVGSRDLWRAGIALTACVVVLLLPAAIAGMKTAPAEPISFRAEPWAGWRFVGSVLGSATAARAASPGAALTEARRSWPAQGAKDSPVAREVGLLYLPDDQRLRVVMKTPQGRVHTRVDPTRPLVWQVLGRYPGTAATGTIGLVDFTSGSVVWDIRNAPKHQGRP